MFKKFLTQRLAQSNLKFPTLKKSFIFHGLRRKLFKSSGLLGAVQWVLELFLIGFC